MFPKLVSGTCSFPLVLRGVLMAKVRDSVRKTRYKELGYERTGDIWRVVDQSTGNCVGPHYLSLSELLCDLERFAKVFGVGSPVTGLVEGQKVLVAAEVTGFSARGGVVLRVEDIDFGSATVHAPPGIVQSV